jgi:hypothetical protein
LSANSSATSYTAKPLAGIRFVRNRTGCARFCQKGRAYERD